MPRFAANLSMLFTEVPFLERFALARQHGFEAVEFLFPYDFPAGEIRSRLRDLGLTLALFNMPPGDWAKGERGIAVLPGREAEFREGVARALEYADALGCKQLHCMAGVPPAGSEPVVSAARYAANLDHACEHAHAAGVRVVIEPINHRDIPGYHLNTVEQAAALVAALGAERLSIQFDIYHLQVTQGDIVPRMRTFLPHIAHMQIADTPGRHEPGTGEIAWEFVFRAIDESGFGGWVGLEYRPAGDTGSGLAWRDRFGLAARPQAASV